MTRTGADPHPARILRGMDPLARDILEFWFGPPGSDPLARSPVWFKSDPSLDAEIRARFGAAIERAARGELDAWTQDPHAAVALVILLDQFSRNAYRNTPASFANDARALGVARDTMKSGAAAKLAYLERYFLSMPLMHDESRETQRESVKTFAALADEAAAHGSSEGIVETLRNAHRYAVRHAEIVERFGRFPHRNKILGRASTPEENEFLQQPGSSF